MNDIFEIESRGDKISFADDTAILYSSHSWNDLKVIAEEDFSRIIKWMDSRLLTINISKTFYVPFTSYSSYLPEYNLLTVIQENSVFKIGQALKIKYLGIYIDAHLKWDVQINFLIKKLRFVAYSLKRINRFYDEKHLRILYHSLVESHLTYSVVAWGAAQNSHIKILETTQRYILKILFKKPRLFPTELLYQEIGVNDIRQLFFLNTLIRQHLNKRELRSINHDYNTRYKINSNYLPASHKNLLQRSYGYLGPKFYNIIPPDLKSINSKSLFKNKIKKWMKTIPRNQIHAYFETL